METGEKGRQADGEEVCLVTGGDGDCMIRVAQGQEMFGIFGGGRSSRFIRLVSCNCRLFQRT